MFADLESRKEELCIEGFELRVNKLEQVFLKVTDVVDASKEDVVSVEEQVKQFIEVRSEEVSPTGLFFQQMQALLTRKFFYMKSHWFQHAILLFFIIPLAVPMIMNLAHPSSRHHESIHDQPEPTTLSHYPGMTVFVASTLGSKVGKPIAKFLNSSENVIVVRMPTAGNIVDEPRKLMLHRIVEKFVHNVPPLAFGVAVDMRESAHLKVKRDIVIYYRTLFPNGAALALTAVANSFYKDETPITTTIGVEQNYPLEVSIIGSATMVTTLTPIFVTFIFTYPILLLATERRRRTIIMYLCARMPRYLYWIAAFVGDSLTAIVPLIVLTVALFGSLYFQVRCLPLYLLVIFPTCVSFLTQSYIFAMIFRNGALATALLQIFNVIIAGVSIFVGGTIASKGGMIVIQILTILFPSAIIFQLSLFLESRCSTIHKSHAHTLTPPQSIFRFCHNHDGIKDASFCGAEILLTAYGGAVFQLIIFTGLALRTWLAQRIQCRREPKELTGRPSEDNDVVEERERVDSMGTASYAVCAQNLRKDYGKKTALRNATFGVSEGEIFGLLGPCGSGKSTILAMLSGVYPVTSGRAYFDGVDVEERPLVGYCTQAHSLLNELTIKQTFKLFAKLAGARQSTRCAELLMEILQLEAKADSVVDNCSCGEKRRISIGVSLIVNPRLQLLDEPTTGVDPRTRRSLWQVLTAFSSQGSTIVMASDSVDESDALCSRIAFLANGEIVGIGNGDHLRQLYGNSYLLSITMYGPDNTLAAQIDSEVQRVFEASPLTVVDNIPGLSWTFPRSPDVPLSELYSNLVDLVDSLPPTPKRDRFPVKDFYIVAANLEDVFHAIAKRNMNQSVEKI
uniref:ABC transporter domain-containing protein n=1 Tax=Panagrellus redivivus TaxID=6233 RepID=A0A7E4V306_PANRE